MTSNLLVKIVFQILYSACNMIKKKYNLLLKIVFKNLYSTFYIIKKKIILNQRYIYCQIKKMFLK
jgi:hypothetical protein